MVHCVWQLFCLTWTTFVISEQHSTSCQVDVGCKKLTFGEDGFQIHANLRRPARSRALWPHHQWAIKKRLVGWLHWRVIIYYCTTIIYPLTDPCDGYLYTLHVVIYPIMDPWDWNLKPYMRLILDGINVGKYRYRSSHAFDMGNNIPFVLTAPQDRNGGGWGQAMCDNRGVLQPLVITLR